MGGEYSNVGPEQLRGGSGFSICKVRKEFLIQRLSQKVLALEALGTEDRHAGEFIIELACVKDTRQVGAPRSAHFSCHHFIKVDTVKKILVLDLSSIRQAASKAFGRIFCEQSFEQRLGACLNTLWVLQFRFANLLKQFLAVLRVKRRKTREHFKQHCSETPPIDSTTMSLTVENLWSEIFRRSAKAIRSATAATDAFLGQAKIGQADVALGIQQHVFWLEVSVDDVKAMNITNGQDNLSSIKTSSCFVETTFLAKMKKQLTPWTVIENKEKLLLGLERHVHADDEWMTDIPENTAFRVGVFDLVSIDDVLLAENFQRVDFFGVVFTNQKDFAYYFQ